MNVDDREEKTPPRGGATITLMDIHTLAQEGTNTSLEALKLAKDGANTSLEALAIARRTETKVDIAIRPIVRRSWEPYAQLVATLALVAILTLLAANALAR